MALNFDPRIKAIHVCILCIFIIRKSLKICIFFPKGGVVVQWILFTSIQDIDYRKFRLT